MSKRAKLSGAFSSVPCPPVQAVMPSNRTSATAGSNAVKVSLLPPVVMKFGLSIPAVPLDAIESNGTVVTIKQSKKPPYTFANPVIDGKPVAGFAYQGYSMVAGGDCAPVTGSFGIASDVRSHFNFKNAKLYAARDQMASVTADTLTNEPMVALGAMWGGDKQIPLVVLASNTSAIFKHHLTFPGGHFVVIHSHPAPRRQGKDTV